MRKPSEFVGHPYPFLTGLGYRAVCKHVVDGDTYDFFVDMGLNRYAYLTVRLYGYDTPETIRPTSEAERVLGQRAKARVAQLILGKPCYLTTYKDAETFGRYLADVRYWMGSLTYDLGATLAAEHLLKEDV